MCKTKIVIKPVITKDPVMPPSAPHHMPTPRPIGGKGLMGGAPMSRPPAPPAAWAPPSAYSGYGAQQQQGFIGYGQQSPYGGGAPSQSNYHQQGHNSFGNPGGGHHQAGASSSYYGNHLGGYTHAAQGPASESPTVHPNGVPSLASFNPYDISSYGGGGKVRSSAMHPSRPTPY